MRKFRRRHTLPDAVCYHARFRHRGLRQQNTKLFPTITRRHISRPQRPLQTMRCDLKRHVSRLMTILIVVSLEVVDIDHQKTHRVIVTLRTIQLFRESLFEITTVRQPGQRISDRHQLKLSSAFLPLSTFEREGDLWPNYLEQAQIDFVINSTAGLVSHI